MKGLGEPNFAIPKTSAKNNPPPFSTEERLIWCQFGLHSYPCRLFRLSLEQLVSAIHATESAQYNFLISEDRYHLDRFHLSAEETELAMHRLENRIPEQEPLPTQVLDLLSHSANRLDTMRGAIRILQRDGQGAALDYHTDQSNQQMRTAFDQSLAAVREPTYAMMDVKVAKMQRDHMMANASFFGASVLNLLLVVSGFILVRRSMTRQEFENWQKSGEAELNVAISSKQNPVDFACSTLGILASYLSAQRGIFYIFHEGFLIKAGGFAAGTVSDQTNAIPLHLEDLPRLSVDSSIAGECLKSKEMIHIREIFADGYQGKPIDPLNLGVSEWYPNEILFFPSLFDHEITGVIELATLGSFSETDHRFIACVQQDIGRSLDNVIRRSEINSLLLEKTRRAEELQMQQEELRASKEELEDQTRALNEAKKRLQLQQEEREQTNLELEQQAHVLEDQKDALKVRNHELMQAKEEIERKAKEVEMGSQFKSEFLAKMSHELRTPLNSVLIMSTLLVKNQQKNLSSKEVDFAKTINKAGSDLLNLINDILDLSKVEAGQLKVDPLPESLPQIAQDIQKIFRPVADEKNLEFIVTIDEGLDPHIISDRQRLEQILNNFLSNAFKFTELGQVSLRIEETHDESVLE